MLILKIILIPLLIVLVFSKSLDLAIHNTGITFEIAYFLEILILINIILDFMKL